MLCCCDLGFVAALSLKTWVDAKVASLQNRLQLLYFAMGFFSKIRNTSGLGGNVAAAGPTYSRTELRPFGGLLPTHTPLPASPILAARLGTLQESVLSIERARKYLADCERPVQPHQEFIRGKTMGRSKRFFRAAAHHLGSFLGVGRGPAPFAKQAWTRPDVSGPEASQSGAGQAKLRQAKALHDGGETSIGESETKPADSSKHAVDDGIGLRGALERERLLVSKSDYVAAVRQMVGDGIDQARQEYVAGLAEVTEKCLFHQSEAQNLIDASVRVSQAKKHQAHLVEESQKLQIDLESLRIRKSQLQERLAALGPQPVEGEAAVTQFHQVQARQVLTRVGASLQAAQKKWVDAQQSLAIAKRQRNVAMPLTTTRAQASQRVTALRLQRDNALHEVQGQQALSARGEALVEKAGQRLQEVERLNERQAQRSALQYELSDTRQLQKDLLRRGTGILADLREHRPRLELAQAQELLAKDAEFSARIALERSQRDAATSLRLAQALEQELPRLDPVEAALVEPLKAACVQAETARRTEQKRLSQRLSVLVESPAGFSADQITPALRQQMQALASRLDEVPQGMSQTKAESVRSLRMPLEQTLEIVSRSVALACGADGSKAAGVLSELMKLPFTDLVPKPTSDSSSKSDEHGGDPKHGGTLKRCAGILCARPGGTELLERCTLRSSPVPTQQIRDAVTVYFKAYNANNSAQTPDRDSLIWLQQAQLAATSLANSGTGVDPATALGRLSESQRIAFNGVRNDLMSVAPGSVYDKVNLALQALSDDWVPAAQSPKGKASPLDARHLATRVGADVKLPTLETDLNKQLAVACDELLKILAHELNEARRAVNDERQQRQLTPPADKKSASQPPLQVPQALLEAQTLLHHIQQQAELGHRIDLLRLNSSVWKKIDKATKTKIKREVDAAHSSVGALRDVTQGLQLKSHRVVPASKDGGPSARLSIKPESAAEMEPAEAKDFSALQMALWEFPVDQPTVLQVLSRLNDELLAVRAVDPAQDPAAGQVPSAEPDIAADLVARLGGIELPGARAESAAKSALEWRSPSDRRSPELRVDESKQPEVALALALVQEEPAAEPLSALENALSQAQTLQERMARFHSRQGDFSDDALAQWVTAALSSSFGTVALQNGRQLGFSTNGLTGVAAQISGALGFTVRPDLEVSAQQRQQLRFSRDTRGLEFSMNQVKGMSGSLSATAYLLGSGAASGPGMGMSHSASQYRGQGGAVVRAPKFGEKNYKDATEDLGQMLTTALTWRGLPTKSGQRIYENPIQALLDRHPTVSVGTYDSLRSTSVSASTSVQAFSFQGGELGDAHARAQMSAGVSTSKLKEYASLKTKGGTQGVSANTERRSHLVAANAAIKQKISVDSGADAAAPLNGTLGGLALNANLRLSSAQSTANMLLRPDGTITSKRYVEFSSYDKFEATVQTHWDKWVLYGMNMGKWPKDFSESDKRAVTEKTLSDFMEKAKSAAQAGQVTFQEYMALKPEVAAQLTANLALEELARLEGRHADAETLDASRKAIMAVASSYSPFYLKVTLHSSINEASGLNLGVMAMKTQGASAHHVHDWFPKVG